jgi:hypothetical protein
MNASEDGRVYSDSTEDNVPNGSAFGISETKYRSTWVRCAFIFVSLCSLFIWDVDMQ